MSESVQPPIGTNPTAPAVVASKQKLSSSAPSRALSRSWTPSTRHVPSDPFTALQYSKWPSSSEKAMLNEWAAHGTRVCSLEVAYMVWKSCRVCVQVAPVGSNLSEAKPLAELAVIDPL